MFVDEKNNVWLSSDTGLFASDTGKVDRGIKGQKLNDVLKISDTLVKRIYQTVDGSIWLISDHRVFQTMTIKHKAVVWDRNVGLKDYPILSFMEDNESNLWFGFSGGLQKLTNRYLRIFHPETLNSFISGFDMDVAGRIWISSDKGVFYYKEKLVDFTSMISLKNEKFSTTILPNKNILLANNKAIIEIDVNTLNIIKEHRFSRPLLTLSRAFVSSKNEIFLITGINGVVYYLKEFSSQPVAIENRATALVHQLVEHGNTIIGGNNTGLVHFSKGTFKKLEDLKSTV